MLWLSWQTRNVVIQYKTIYTNYLFSMYITKTSATKAIITFVSVNVPCKEVTSLRRQVTFRWKSQFGHLSVTISLDSTRCVDVHIYMCTHSNCLQLLFRGLSPHQSSTDTLAHMFAMMVTYMHTCKQSLGCATFTKESMFKTCVPPNQSAPITRRQ